MYKHILGNPKASTEIGQAMGGNQEEFMHLMGRVVQDIEQLKQGQASSAKKGEDRFKYLDNRNLYSTE